MLRKRGQGSISDAIKAIPIGKPGIGAYDGNIDYLNLAIATLNKFNAKLKTQPRERPSDHLIGFIRKLTPTARKWALGIFLGISAAGASWSVAPEPLRRYDQEVCK